VVQERTDQHGVEVLDIQRVRLDTGALLREAEQQPERVAVGGDRVRADLALVDSRSLKNACIVGASPLIAPPPSARGVPSSAALPRDDRKRDIERPATVAVALEAVGGQAEQLGRRGRQPACRRSRRTRRPQPPAWRGDQTGGSTGMSTRAPSAEVPTALG
jgi:hypothetical protein